MVEVAQSYFRLALAMAPSDQEQLREYLRRRAAEILVSVYAIDGTIDVEVEDGSVRAWITASVVGIGGLVASYGSLRQSIDYLVHDAQAFSEQVHELVLH